MNPNDLLQQLQHQQNASLSQLHGILIFQMIAAIVGFFGLLIWTFLIAQMLFDVRESNRLILEELKRKPNTEKESVPSTVTFTDKKLWADEDKYRPKV